MSLINRPESQTGALSRNRSAAPHPASSLTGRSSSRIADRIYIAILIAASACILIIVAALALQLTIASKQSMQTFGLNFLTSDNWDPNKHLHGPDRPAGDFGARLFILGTLWSSFLALLIATPVSVGCAIFLAEVAPPWLRNPISFLVELLAAIPSVVYGLWGIFIMIPWIAAHVETPISKHRVGHLGLFAVGDEGITGQDMLAAALVLSIMVTPYITAVSRDILRAIPKSVREGSYALGATRWETIRSVVLPYARAGIVGAVILGLGRALGETMAVTMVCGNNTDPFSISLFKSTSTMASIIAGQMPEAQGLLRSALIEIALVLFLVTMTVNAGARLLVYLTAKDIQGGGRRA